MKTTAIALACIFAIADVFASADAAEVARQPVVAPQSGVALQSGVAPQSGAAPISVLPPDAARPGAPKAGTSDVPRTKPEGAKAEATKTRPEGSRRIEPPRGRVCFNASETREKIATHRLTEPFRALRAGRFQGEALRARLCRWKPDEFIYEVAVLRRDGRIAHLYMNAQNGQSVGALTDSDRN